MTLSATGEAETPAGGSVCIRWGWKVSCFVLMKQGEREEGMGYLEISHEAPAG